MEALSLRVKDLDFSRGEVTVLQTKGHGGRVTMLPSTLVAPIQEHLLGVKRTHERDLADGWGRVLMPER